MRIIPPPLLFLFCALLALLPTYFFPFPLGRYSRMTGIYAAVALTVAAAALGLSAVREMNRSHTPVEPWKTPVRLVTSGPYRFSRNPIYVTFVLILVAIGIAANSAWFLAAALLGLILLDRLVIRREEALLQGLFGEDYAAYRTRVRRWL